MKNCIFSNKQISPATHAGSSERSKKLFLFMFTRHIFYTRVSPLAENESEYVVCMKKLCNCRWLFDEQKFCWTMLYWKRMAIRWICIAINISCFDRKSNKSRTEFPLNFQSSCEIIDATSTASINRLNIWLRNVFETFRAQTFQQYPRSYVPYVHVTLTNFLSYATQDVIAFT